MTAKIEHESARLSKEKSIFVEFKNVKKKKIYDFSRKILRDISYIEKTDELLLYTINNTF